MRRKRKNSMVHSSPHLGGLVYDWRYHIEDAAVARTNVGYSDGALEVFTPLDTGDTIVSYSGTSTPTLDIGNDKITFTIGTIYDLLLSNGTFISFSEGSGLPFDASSKNPLLITDASNNLWTESLSDIGYNLLNSCNIGRVCDASGTLSRTQTQAYGEWIIDAIWDRPVANMDFYFMSTANDVSPNTNGYVLRVGSTGELDLRYVLGASNGSVDSVAGYIDTDPTQYRIRITRSPSGLFTFCGQKQGSSYPVGGEDWETLGSGIHNTTTTSAYMLYEGETDKVELLTIFIDTGILNLSTDTTTATGTWSTKYIPVEYGKENIDVLGRITIQRNGNWWNNCESALDLSSIEPIGLKCTSSGDVYCSSAQAYGTWEFDIYHTASGTERIVFINQNTRIPISSVGYYIFIGLTEHIQLIKSTGASFDVLFDTGPNYVSVDTWYKIKVIRSVDGEFSCYIKGGSFGDIYVLINPSGGSGFNPIIDNTYTTSLYMVVDLDIDNSIRSIYIDNTFKSGDNFTVSNGIFSDIDVMDRSNTDIWKSAARSAITYDSGNPYEWTPEDLALIDDWVEDDYANIAYAKYTESHLVSVLVYDHQLTDEEDQTTRDWVADGLPYINASYVTHDGIVADYDGYNVIFYD